MSYIIRDRECNQKDTKEIYNDKNTKLYEFYFYIDGLINNPNFHNLSDEDLDALKYLKKFFEVMNEGVNQNTLMSDVEEIIDCIIDQAKKGVF